MVKKRAVISGVAAELPENILSNYELGQMVDLSYVQRYGTLQPPPYHFVAGNRKKDLKKETILYLLLLEQALHGGAMYLKWGYNGK